MRELAKLQNLDEKIRIQIVERINVTGEEVNKLCDIN